MTPEESWDALVFVKGNESAGIRWAADALIALELAIMDRDA
jgi:hypothetical protein